MSTPVRKVCLLIVQISHLDMAQQDRFQIATPEVAMDGSPVRGDVTLASLIARINMLDDAHLAEIETHVAEIERNIQNYTHYLTHQMYHQIQFTLQFNVR